MQVIIVAVVDAKDPRWKSGQSKLLLLLMMMKVCDGLLR